MKSAHLQSVSLCLFLSSESGKTYLFKFCTDTFLVKPVCLIEEGDMMAGWCRGESMVPERRQAHEPYLYSLSYLATQCINNMNWVTKCRFALWRILLCKWSVNMRGNCWLRCHVYMYMISKHLIQKYMSADLRKGSFRHFSSFCVIKISKRLNFQDFACSYTRFKLLLTCNTIKGANSSQTDKIK